MKGDVHWLKEVQKGGRVIILDDESIWEIAPPHAGDICTWDLVSGIAVSDGMDPVFPIKLVNTGIGESVDARYVGRRPQEAKSAVPIVQHTISSFSVGFPA